MARNPVGQAQATPAVPAGARSRKAARVALPSAGVTAVRARSRKTGQLVVPARLTPQWSAAPRATKLGRVRPGVAFPQAFGVYPSVVIPDAVFSVAEEAADRYVLGTFRVDWTNQDYTGVAADLSRTVTSMVVERSRTGELPEGAGTPDGFDSATAKVDLMGRRAGSELTLAAELSPFRGDSPLYGAATVTPMSVIEMGLRTDEGVKLYRQFTGPLRTFKIDEDTERVAMSLVDPNERLRELITLPTFAEFASHAKRRPWRFTINTMGLVDLVCRRNRIFASPPPRSDAIISCTGHGMLAAEVGFNGAPVSIDTTVPPKSGFWVDDRHPWKMLGTPEPAKSGTLVGCGYQEFYGITDGDTPPVRFASGQGVGVHGWLHAGSYMTGSSSTEQRLWHIRPTVNDGPRLFVNVMGNGSVYAGIVLADGTIVGTPKVQLGPAPWHGLGAFWRWTSNTNLEVTLRVDGVTRTYALTHSAVSITPTPFYDGYKATVQLRAHFTRSWTNLQLWPKSTAPTLAEWQALENWTSQCDIARGLNELLYLPNVAAVDSWDLLKAIVGAEFGVHGFDLAGRYFFRPRTDVRNAKVDKAIDVATNLSSVGYSVSSDSVRNVIGYSATPQYHGTDGKGVNSTTAVVTAQDVLQFTVPAGKRYQYEVDWPFGAAGWRGGVLPYCYQEKADTAARDASNGFQKWTGDVQHGWTYSTKGASGNWSIYDNSQSVVVRYCQISARRAIVIVDNTAGSKDIRLATAQEQSGDGGFGEGEPALRIGGWPLKAFPARVATYRNEASIAKYRSARALELPDSEWRQTPDVLEPVCQQLLAAMADPIPVLENLPVRGDPRVQVGQTASVQFRGKSAPVLGTIVKTVRTLNESGLADDISVRPLPVQTLAPLGWSFYVDISHYQYDGDQEIDLERLKALGYAGCVAKIGQGGGTETLRASPRTWGNTLDDYWPVARNEGRRLWPSTFAGYWWIGNNETPADQAARCAAAIGDKSIPVMLDWEDSGGKLDNVVACRDAFRAQGLKVTMLYCGQGYVSAANGGGNPSNIDSATGLNVIRARYYTNDQDHPRVLFDATPNPAGFYLAAFNGATPDAAQFTQAGVVYPGMVIDVDAFPGDAAGLSRMFYGL